MREKSIFPTTLIPRNKGGGMSNYVTMTQHTWHHDAAKVLNKFKTTKNFVLNSITLPFYNSIKYLSNIMLYKFYHIKDIIFLSVAKGNEKPLSTQYLKWMNYQFYEPFLNRWAMTSQKVSVRMAKGELSPPETLLPVFRSETASKWRAG